MRILYIVASPDVQARMMRLGRGLVIESREVSHAQATELIVKVIQEGGAPTQREVDKRPSQGIFAMITMTFAKTVTHTLQSELCA